MAGTGSSAGRKTHQAPVFWRRYSNKRRPVPGAWETGATMRDIEVRMTGSNVGISYGVQTGPGGVIDRSAIPG